LRPCVVLLRLIILIMVVYECVGRCRNSKTNTWFPTNVSSAGQRQSKRDKEKCMRLVSSVGAIVLWVVLVGLPLTGRAGPSSWPDPVAQIAVQQYVSEVAELGDDADRHGVWLQSEDGMLAHHQGTVPLPVASLTKVATTLAALRAWGPMHQFVTLVDATGPIQDGVLRGDLIVQGSGDPFFVTEDAMALRQSLWELGLKRVTGKLVISGNFFMNFTTNPPLSGKLLKQVLSPPPKRVARKWQRAAASEMLQLTIT